MDLLFIFTRPLNVKIFIFHIMDLIRKLSLALYDEDLHYFLPSFISYKLGDFVDIEAFSYSDYGTIIDYFKSKTIDQTIYYKIRSRQNVEYTLNYYQITDRASPQI